MASIESVSHEKRVFPPPAAFAAQANVTKADFERLNAEREKAELPRFATIKATRQKEATLSAR